MTYKRERIANSLIFYTFLLNMKPSSRPSTKSFLIFGQSFLNFRLSSSRLLIKWFLIRKEDVLSP